MDTKGHGKPWCNMHRREADCDDCKVGIITRCTPFSNFGGKPGYGGKAKTLWEQAESRCHRVGQNKPVFTAHVGGLLPDEFKVDGGMPSMQYRVTFSSTRSGLRTRFWTAFRGKYMRRPAFRCFETVTPRSKNDIFKEMGVSADAAYGRQVVHNRSESMRRWVDGCWPLSLRQKLQELIADADYMALEKRMMSRAGVTKVHDDFLVDLEKWVDLYEVGELVRHKGKLARVMKVTGPLVTLKYRGRTYETTFTVMDWEIEKTGPINWIKKMWRKRKK